MTAASVIGAPRATEAPYAIVRQLGFGDIPTYLARVQVPGSDPQLVVVERLVRQGTVTDEQAAAYVHDATLAADLIEPNIVRVRAVTVEPEEIIVATDFVDGTRLEDLWSLAPDGSSRMPLEIALRVLLDVLAGLSSLHKVRDEKDVERRRLVHAEVTAANVIVGVDGVSRLLRTCRIRRPGALPKNGTETLAPEVLSGAPIDQRADVFSVGALLSRALGVEPAAGATQLAALAARAMAAVPDKRFPTAAAMATELRRIAGSKLATSTQVAEFVRVVASATSAARREEAALDELIEMDPPASSTIELHASTSPKPMSGMHVKARSSHMVGSPLALRAAVMRILKEERHARTRPVPRAPASAPPILASQSDVRLSAPDGEAISIWEASVPSPHAPPPVTDSSHRLASPPQTRARLPRLLGMAALVTCVAAVVFGGWRLLRERNRPPAALPSSEASVQPASAPIAAPEGSIESVPQAPVPESPRAAEAPSAKPAVRTRAPARKPAPPPRVRPARAKSGGRSTTG
jgi:hypothetical protein